MRFALSCGDPVELKNRGFREVFVSNFAHGRDTLARDTEALSCDAEMIGSDFSKAFGYFQDEPEMAQLSANKRWKDVVKARMKQEDGTTKARA
ncbi:hypothetical protein SAMN03159444_02263 [Pseudomonas sp. NFACC02]|uniref:hypothetical protein n=1 Tax=Pseudomonas sp. NFACC02 TaxID=1566250 RepID=UPI0008B89EAE|nr:hypothetical protein [Pseudomonas sp. NFACC02]SEQ70175.1 hypothetical protein SAMN03159444_02263 [Pseudomonas sp. NFACC02]